MEALTLDEGRTVLYHVADQVGPDQVAEMMIDYLSGVVGTENLSEFQKDMAATLEALMVRHLGERV